MSKPDECLKEQFINRYEKLNSSARLINDSINLLCSINPDVECRTGATIGIEEFISKIPEYNALSEDADTVKQILQEASTNKREFLVALAELNYSYDVACYKAAHLLFIKDQFNCFF